MSTTAGTIGGTAGSVAGGALGGVIGGFLGGPVGAWIGRTAGSRIGRLAGAAAAEALASMMEDANEDAETETNEEEADKTCKDCQEIDCFTPPENADREEFAKQLKDQQDAINQMSPDEIIENMDRYAEFGRGAGDATSRAAERFRWIEEKADEIAQDLMSDGVSAPQAEAEGQARARTEASTKDVIHNPDLSAGGDGTLGGLGDRSINRSIGSQWGKGRSDQLRQNAEQAQAQGADRMNVDLNVCPEDDSGGEGGQTGTPSGTGSPGNRNASPPIS